MGNYVGVKEVKEVNEVVVVNDFLSKGWEILHISIVVLPDANRRAGCYSETTYVIGKR